MLMEPGEIRRPDFAYTDFHDMRHAPAGRSGSVAYLWSDMIGDVDTSIGATIRLGDSEGRRADGKVICHEEKGGFTKITVEVGEITWERRERGKT